MEQRDTSHDITLSTKEAVAGFCICMMLGLICLKAAASLMSAPGWKAGIAGFYLLIFGLILVVLAIACGRDFWKELRPRQQSKPTGAARLVR